MRGERVSIEELERALAFVAALIVRDGDQYAPLLDRLEREVEAARRNSATARARRVLERYRVEADAADPIHLTSDPPRARMIEIAVHHPAASPEPDGGSKLVISSSTSTRNAAASLP